MIFVVISVVLLVNKGVSNQLATKEIQGNLLIDLMINSDILAPVDVTGKVHIGEVDLNKVNTEYLSKKMSSTPLGAELVLYDNPAGTALGKTEKGRAYVNEVEFKKGNPMTKVSGKGSYGRVERWIAVRVNGEPMHLHITVVVSYD